MCFVMNVEIDGEMVRVEFHMYPHAEELAAIAAWIKCGTKEHLNRYCANGSLSLGTGGGPFDEHSNNGNSNRCREECCLTLVAKTLEIFNDPTWRFLIAHCHYAETGRLLDPRKRLPPESNHPFDFYRMVNLRWQALREKVAGEGKDEPSQEEMEEVARQGIWDALTIVCDQEIFQLAMAALRDENRVQAEEIQGPRGMDLKLVAVRLNDKDGQAGSKIVKAAIAWCQADVIIWQNPGGDVHIATNQRTGFRIGKTEGTSPCDLDDLACCLRVEEQRIRGDEDPEGNWATLRQEGSAYEGDPWYYDRLHGGLHNGTRSYPDVPLTVIDFEVITKIVRMAIMDHGFEKSRARKCRKDQCEGSSCPRYKYGLECCREVRARIHRARNEGLGK